MNRHDSEKLPVIYVQRPVNDNLSIANLLENTIEICILNLK